MSTAESHDGGNTAALDPWALPLIAAAPKVAQIVTGEIPVPEVVEVFLTNHCNFGCPHCRFRAVHGPRDEHMSVQTFKALLGELRGRGVRRLELSGGGEPLDHPEIEEIMGLIAEEGFRIGLITNGYLMVGQPQLVRRVSAVADWIRFSIDAFSEKTFARVHGRSEISYERMRGVVLQLASSGSLPKIGLKMLISSLNADDAALAIREALALEADYLQLKFLGAPEQFVLQPDEIRDISARLTEQIAGLSGQKTHVEFLPPYLGNPLDGRCLMTYLHGMVDWDGAVYVCPFFEHRKAKHSIGNIRDGGFFRHWDDPRHTDVFEGIDPNTCVPNCPMRRYNPVVYFIMREQFRMGYI